MPVDHPPARPPLFILTSKASPQARLRSALAQAATIVDDDCVHVIEGATPADAIVESLFDARLARRWSKYPPVPAEVAAYATHRLAWQALLDGGGPSALVLEDDFVVLDGRALRRMLAAACDLLSERRDIVKLFDLPGERERGRSFTRTIAGIEIVKREHVRAGLVGYLISRDGAARFLSRGRIFRVVDEDIKHHWELGLDIWSVPQNLVADASAELGGSLIENARTTTRRRSVWRSLKGNLLAAHRNWRTRGAFDQWLRQQEARRRG
ncbi:glycosyltransferase family 25 protein [Aquibium carbonis]|uniref:Glycosyltransferase family 25 protein n=1 Tax=Aquibium carbonis TaxID=2495581 RepID=A0A3R9Y5A7_9HYPH|nr:glycosyltransferase family 25 protein [Aquibium carbonis]RST80051.1 glycosyltransferase family 25 protein [Aquibium carbonis]